MSIHEQAVSFDVVVIGGGFAGVCAAIAAAREGVRVALVQNRFGGHGLYLLDEPEAALSPTRQLTLLGEMHHLVHRDSQFIVATHSPILMAYPRARIYQLNESGIEPVQYRETEHYQLTRRFLENPERMLRYLLET